MRRIVTSLALAVVSAGVLVMLRWPEPPGYTNSFESVQEIIGESPDVMEIGLRVEVTSDTAGLRTRAEECFASELPGIFPGTDLASETPDVLAADQPDGQKMDAYASMNHVIS